MRSLQHIQKERLNGDEKFFSNEIQQLIAKVQQQDREAVKDWLQQKYSNPLGHQKPVCRECRGARNFIALCLEELK